MTPVSELVPIAASSDAPSRRRLRLRAAAVASAFLLNGAMFGTWASRIPAIREQAGLDETSLGFAILAAGVGAVLTMSIGGWLGGRFGSNVMTAVTLLGCALLQPLVASASSFAMLAGVLFVFGAAQGTMDVCMNANGLAVERAGMGPIMSRLHASWSIGSFGGAAISALVVGAGVPLLAQFSLLAVVLAAGSGWLALAMLPDRHTSPGGGLRRPPRRIVAIGIVAFCGLLAEGSASDWSGLYMTRVLGSTQEIAAVTVAVFAFSMAGARLAGDRLVLRFGPARLVAYGGTLAAVGLGLALVVAEPPFAIAGFAMMGLGLAATVPVAFRAGGSQPGVPSAVGIAAVSTMGYAGSLAGPPLIGLIAGVSGLRLALGIVAVLLVGLVVGGWRTLSAPITIPEPAVPEEELA